MHKVKLIWCLQLWKGLLIILMPLQVGGKNTDLGNSAMFVSAEREANKMPGSMLKIVG